jgi:hypothetical protein
MAAVGGCYWFWPPRAPHANPRMHPSCLPSFVFFAFSAVNHSKRCTRQSFNRKERKEHGEAASEVAECCAIGTICGHRFRRRQMRRLSGFAGNLRFKAGAGYWVQFKRLVH